MPDIPIIDRGCHGDIRRNKTRQFQSCLGKTDMVNVAVIGCGLLGSKVAGELAYHGHNVKLYDSNSKALQSVFPRLQQDKSELQAAGILKHHTFIGQVICLSHLHEAVTNVDFIFETIKEDIDAKQEIFERISQCCSEGALIATSTLRLDLRKITAHAVQPERAIGIRFLYPVYCIPEVEVTMGPQTSLDTLKKGLAKAPNFWGPVEVFFERMGKTIFFRSGPEPLILTQQQRDLRILARKDQVEQNKGLGGRHYNLAPELAHCGNFAPSQDGEMGAKAEIERECAICMNRVRDCVFHPCHHMCTCADCGRLLASRRDSCPICRTSIMEVIRIFHS